ncbi:MAG: PAS domain S-box protein [Methylococcaceae bacterium]
MKKEMDALSGTDLLRKKAEEKLNKKDSGNRQVLSEVDTLQLLHELEVHQIELEMQLEELELARSKAEIAIERFTELYDFAPAGYFTIDRDSKITELNLSGAKMLGTGRSNLINRKISQFITQDTLPAFNGFLHKVFEPNPKATCEIALNIAGRPTSYLHLEGMIFDDENKCQITAIDISENKRSEELLRFSEMRYRRLFESAQDGILILDAFNHQIIDVNPSLIKKIGYFYDELLGKQLWEVGIFKSSDESKNAFTELHQIGYIRIEDMPVETKNGNSIIVEFVSNIYVVDQFKVIQCNIRDITQRKQAEEALKESELRLRELNATKDKFFSIIAHDLKSPFNAIYGFCNILIMQMKEKDYLGIDKYAGIILDSSQRAMDLLMNLLEWSRSQTGTMNFHPEKIDLISLIEQVTEISNDTALQKSISIHTHLPDKAIAFADNDMLNAIFRNLISNAIKFTRQGGEIVITVEQEKDDWKVTISDNGVGINKEALDKLFRIDASYKTAGTNNETGTGLGLLLCKEFIDKHGAKIWVESEVGIGSRFYFTIPQLTE